jgi:hypothetical protein
MKKMILIAAAILALATAAFAATTFYVPTGYQYTDRLGIVYTPDSNGYITIPSSGASDAAGAGLVRVENLGSAGSVTCTKGVVTAVPVGLTQHGTVFACISTNKGVVTTRY